MVPHSGGLCFAGGFYDIQSLAYHFELAEAKECHIHALFSQDALVIIYVLN